MLVGSASIYRIIPCDAETALKAISNTVRRPFTLVRLAEGKQLPAAPDDSYESADEENEEESAE